jgi:hypothetical protein
VNEKYSFPQYSYWPILLAIGIGLIAVGLVSTIIISIFALLLVFVAIIGWVWENRGEHPEDENEQP